MDRAVRTLRRSTDLRHGGLCVFPKGATSLRGMRRSRAGAIRRVVDGQDIIATGQRALKQSLRECLRLVRWPLNARRADHRQRGLGDGLNVMIVDRHGFLPRCGCSARYVRIPCWQARTRLIRVFRCTSRVLSCLDDTSVVPKETG